MATRRQAREWAVQLLVMLDLNPEPGLERSIVEFWPRLREIERERREEDDRTERILDFSPEEKKLARKYEQSREFAEERVRGVTESLAEIDAAIGKLLKNWSMYRLGTVERNVLRLGVWELEHHPEIPPPIVINEYVDLAKFFSETKSGRFVNGVLDNYAKTLQEKKEGGGEASVKRPSRRKQSERRC